MEIVKVEAQLSDTAAEVVAVKLPVTVRAPAAVVVNVPVPLTVKSVIVRDASTLRVLVPGTEIVTLSATPGTPLGVQFVVVPQAELVAPFQV